MRRPSHDDGGFCELRGAFFRFRRDFFFYKAFQAVEFFVNSLAKILEILDALEPREFFIDTLAVLLEFVHKCQTPRENRLKEKKRGDLGIIGTWFAGRKEENWRFPTGGSGAWKNGKMPCADFSAATSSRGRNSVRPAMRWSESMRHAATSAVRTCDSLSQR